MSKIQSVPFSQIRTDGLQVRAETNRAHIDDLAELMEDGWPDSLPPVVAFHDGQQYHLADGHHRYQAAQEAGCEEIPCDVRQGDKTAALWHAIGSNATHGLRRTNEDKRRAVLLAYQLDPALSDNAIAQRCHVSQPFVSHYLRDKRQAASTYNGYKSEGQSPAATVGKPGPSTGLLSESDSKPAPDIRTDARGRKMDVSRIGRKPSKLEADAEGGPAILAATEMDEAIRLLRQAQQRIGDAAKLPGGELLRSHYLKCEKTGNEERFRSPDVGNAIREIEHWRPHGACPSCRETVQPGCRLCRGTGWVTKLAMERCPDRLKNAIVEDGSDIA